MTSTINYFGNGSKNEEGKFVYTVEFTNNKKMEYSFNYVNTFDWSIKDQSMFEKLIDARLTPGYLKYDDKLADEKETKKFFSTKESKNAVTEMERSFVKGKTTEYKVSFIDNDKLSLEDSNEKEVNIYTRANAKN
jgi:hypothetical protein